eukprot:4381383-Pyramimonas_sp.AAC.1
MGASKVAMWTQTANPATCTGPRRTTSCLMRSRQNSSRRTGRPYLDEGRRHKRRTPAHHDRPERGPT